MPLSSTVIPTDRDQVDPNELVRRALGGCAESFSELAQRYRPRLMNLLHHRLGGHWADAEDIAQDTLTRAFQQLHRFDSRYQFSTWLYTIALRLASDHLRGERRRRDHQRLQPAARCVDDGSVPDQLMHDETIGNIWSTARSCLAQDQFTALWLRFGEELSVAETARAMRKTQVGVRVLLYRARRKLLQILVTPDHRISMSNAGMPGVQR